MFRKVLMSCALVAATLAPATSTSAVQSNTAGAPFPECSSSTEESCVELLQFTPTVGATENIDDPANTVQSDHAYVRFFDQGSGCPTCFPMLGFAILDNRSGSTFSGTNDGLEAGTYRMKVRIGDFDPTVFISSGPVVSYAITKGSDGYWTLDATLRPFLAAGPSMADSGDCSGRSIPGVDGWPAQCETAGWATLRSISGGVVSFSGFPSSVSAADVRGMWVATNATGFQWPSINLLTKSISATVVGPHALPSDLDCDANQFDTEALTGKCLTPAHYSAYVPFSVLTTLLGASEDIVKEFISSDAMTAQAYGTQSAPFTLTVGVDGITVKFGIDHYSKPNPKITFKSLPTLKRGKSKKASEFFTLPRGASLVEFKVSKQSRTGQCKVSPTRVVTAHATRTGQCVLTWRYKLSGSTVVKVKKVAVKVV